jgi:hypothetical protein
MDEWYYGADSVARYSGELISPNRALIPHLQAKAPEIRGTPILGAPPDGCNGMVYSPFR